MRRPPKNLVAGAAIAGFVGINGAGKTALAVECAMADMAQGRPVFSTVQITSPYGDSTPITSLRQLLTLRDATILLDEVATIFSARSTQSLPNDVEILLQTLRHSGNSVLWTAPGWMRADTLLRSVTRAVVAVTPLLPKRQHDSPWSTPRLVFAAVLDASTGKQDAAPEKTLRRRLYRLRGLQSIGCYDTLADTPLLARHRTGGRCVDCGGTIDVPKHSEARHLELGIEFYATGADGRPRAVEPHAHRPDTVAETEDAPA